MYGTGSICSNLRSICAAVQQAHVTPQPTTCSASRTRMGYLDRRRGTRGTCLAISYHPQRTEAGR